MRSAASKRITNNRRLILDFIALLVLLLCSVGISLWARVDTITAVLLFLLLPSIFLCIRSKKNLKKISLASLVLGLCGGMAYDIAAELNHAYIVHYQNAFLAYHFIGVTPVGDIIWAFLIPFSTIVFYEHFLDDERVPRISHKWSAAFGAGIILLGASLWWAMMHFGEVAFPYAYFTVGLLSVLPGIGLLFSKHKLVRKLIVAGVYFAFMNMVFEFVGTALNLWNFPGTYIGYLPWGVVSIPLEEFVFWIVPSSIVILFCYEFLFDDYK